MSVVRLKDAKGAKVRKTVVFVVAALIGATTLAGPAQAQQQSPSPAPSAAPAKGSVQLNVNTAINRSLVDKYVRDAPNVALAKCDGVKTKAADFLGINRNTLNKKVKDLGIEAAE